jgi:hypothetical protein
LQQTARNNPKSLRAALWLGKPDDAIASWPASAAAWHDKGVAEARAGEFRRAEQALREASAWTRHAPPATQLGSSFTERANSTPPSAR